MQADPSDAPLFNTAAVVQRTAVPAVTIRAWERRYGFPKPQRAPGGQRLYSERDIQAIQWLSDQTAHGVAISRAVDMLRGGYAQPEPGSHRLPHAIDSARSFETIRSELGAALLALDASAAQSVLAETFLLFSVEDVCLNVLQPLLIEIGDRWHAGEVSVAEEHYVSSFVRSRAFALLQAYQTLESQRWLVLTACAPDEWHEVGILIVSLFLARRGLAVRYLGPNLPLEGLSAIAARHHPAAVVLSAQSRETAQQLRWAGAALEEGPAPHPKLFLGGQAFNADARLRAAIPGTYVGADAAAAVDTIVQQLEHAGDAPRRTRSDKRPG